jgi:hypothetical protein
MSRGAATHGHARAMERLADCGKMTAQLRTDLAQGPTLCIRVGRTFNVHGVTVAAVRLDVASRDQVAISPGRRVAGSRTGICWTVAYADTRLDGVSAWGELALLIACLVVAGSILIALQANAAGAIQFRKIQYDPVGSDVPATNSQLNAEYVTIKNTGTTTRTLRGWTVRDPREPRLHLRQFQVRCGQECHAAHWQGHQYRQSFLLGPRLVRLSSRAGTYWAARTLSGTYEPEVLVNCSMIQVLAMTWLYTSRKPTPNVMSTGIRGRSRSCHG